MVATPREPGIKDLNRKVKRLELLVLALIASDGTGMNGDSDLLHFFRKSFRNSDDFRDDRDFYDFFEELMYQSRGRESNLRNTVDNLESLVKESQHEFRSQKEHSDYKIDHAIEKVQTLENNLKLANKELHHYLMYQSVGVESQNIALDRFIPVRVYLSDDEVEDIENVTNAVTGLLDAFGFQFSDDFPAEKGSWWKKWFARSKEVITQPEVTDRLAKIERAIDIKGLHKPQADVDKTQAEAIATLIASVKDIQSVAIQAGSILLVKVTNGKGDPCLQVRTLSTKELIYLENNQHILCKPAKIMESLSHGSQHILLEGDGSQNTA
jgi:hypothetical protein